MNRRNALLRSRDVKKFIQTAAKETEWERILMIVRAGCERFGGTASLIKSLLAEVERLPPNSHSTLKLQAMTAYVNLLAAAEQQRSNPSIHTLDSSDILDFWEHRLQTMIRDSPEVVLQTAAKLGWEVQEPLRWDDGSPRRVAAVATGQ